MCPPGDARATKTAPLERAALKKIYEQKTIANPRIKKLPIDEILQFPRYVNALDHGGHSHPKDYDDEIEDEVKHTRGSSASGWNRRGEND